MRRVTILFVALLGLLLAACAPANTPTPAPSSTAAPATAVTQPVATKPVATPDIAKIIKAQPDDWKRGPDDAKVTIIEWGDFQ